MSTTSTHGPSGGMGSALLAILAVPILLCCLGAWEIQRAGATRAEYADLASQQRHHLTMVRDRAPPMPGAGIPPPDATIAPSKQAVAAADADLLVARLRQGAAWLTLLAGIVAGTAGLAGMWLVSRSAAQGRRSRAELVVTFGTVGRVLPVILGLQVVGGVLALAAAVAFEVSGLWFIPDPGDRTVLLAILALICSGLFLWGAVTTLRDLRAALRALQPAPLAVSAMPIAEAQAPGLFALLRDVARERGTTVPEVVAVGAERGFFVTALPLRLRGGPDAAPLVTRGRTLHLSLAEMATLDLEELRTVLAHELAHFAGQDTDYSLHFQPLYTRLGEGAEAMSRRRSDWGSTWVDRLFERAVHPHTILAVHAYERFSHVVAHWSRLRELEADRAAIASGSATALASSLLRLGLAEALLRAALDRIIEQSDAASSDLATILVAHMGAEGADDPAAHLGDRAPHPTDTHPSAQQRIAAAGVIVDAMLLTRAARRVAPAELAAVQALFADWSTLSGELTDRLRTRVLLRQERQRDWLQKTAAATAGQPDTLLYASLLRPGLGLAVLGSLCLVISVGCVLAARYGGAQDREAWRFLSAVAAVGILGLGFVALWSVRLWRGRKRPFLVLTGDGIQSPGFAGMVPWLDVTGIGVSSRQSPTAWFILRPEASLPRRTRSIRRLRIDPKQHAVQFMGLLPQGLDEATFRDLLLRYAEAAHARHALGVMKPARDPALGSMPEATGDNSGAVSASAG